MSIYILDGRVRVGMLTTYLAPDFVELAEAFGRQDGGQSHCDLLDEGCKGCKTSKTWTFFAIVKWRPSTEAAELCNVKVRFHKFELTES